jgi:anti-sigma regulatory factor (Ser/Thr protein kinase)
MDDMELVVSELATNAFLHARTASAVTLERQGSTVLLTVEDYGSGFEPSTRRSSATDVAGRGLMITDLVSDGWGVVDGGRQPTSVWASFSTRTYP